MPLTDQEIEAFVRMKYRDLPEGKYDLDKSPNGLTKQGRIHLEAEEMKVLRDAKLPKPKYEEDKPNYTC